MPASSNASFSERRTVVRMLQAPCSDIQEVSTGNSAGPRSPLPLPPQPAFGSQSMRRRSACFPASTSDFMSSGAEGGNSAGPRPPQLLPPQPAFGSQSMRRRSACLPSSTISEDMITGAAGNARVGSTTAPASPATPLRRMNSGGMAGVGTATTATPVTSLQPISSPISPTGPAADPGDSPHHLSVPLTLLSLHNGGTMRHISRSVTAASSRDASPLIISPLTSREDSFSGVAAAAAGGGGSGDVVGGGAAATGPSTESSSGGDNISNNSGSSSVNSGPPSATRHLAEPDNSAACCGGPSFRGGGGNPPGGTLLGSPIPPPLAPLGGGRLPTPMPGGSGGCNNISAAAVAAAAMLPGMAAQSSPVLGRYTAAGGAGSSFTLPCRSSLSISGATGTSVTFITCNNSNNNINSSSSAVDQHHPGAMLASLPATAPTASGDAESGGDAASCVTATATLSMPSHLTGTHRPPTPVCKEDDLLFTMRHMASPTRRRSRFASAAETSLLAAAATALAAEDAGLLDSPPRNGMQQQAPGSGLGFGSVGYNPSEARNRRAAFLGGASGGTWSESGVGTMFVGGGAGGVPSSGGFQRGLAAGTGDVAAALRSPVPVATAATAAAPGGGGGGGGREIWPVDVAVSSPRVAGSGLSGTWRSAALLSTVPEESLPPPSRTGSFAPSLSASGPAVGSATSAVIGCGGGGGGSGHTCPSPVGGRPTAAAGIGGGNTCPSPVGGRPMMAAASGTATETSSATSGGSGSGAGGPLGRRARANGSNSNLNLSLGPLDVEFLSSQEIYAGLFSARASQDSLRGGSPTRTSITSITTTTAAVATGMTPDDALSSFMHSFGPVAAGAAAAVAGSSSGEQRCPLVTPDVGRRRTTSLSGRVAAR